MLSVFQAIPFELIESHPRQTPTLSTPRGDKCSNQYRPLCEVCPRDRGKVVGTLQGQCEVCPGDHGKVVESLRGCSHFIFNICFSFSHRGHCLVFAGWSPEQL